MFTGIIESLATVRSTTGKRLWLDVPFADELILGQSVACDGVCLTVVESDASGFAVDVLDETLDRTRFAALSAGEVLNVERAMKVGDRLDGHIVQAHCEGLGVVEEIEELSAGDRLLTVTLPQELMRYVVMKGIIVLNGIALTLISVDDEAHQIQVAIIPHTWEQTNLHTLNKGDTIHVETDVFAKYAERLTKA